MRLHLLLFCFLLIGFLVLSRLFYWQVLRFEELAAAAERQHFISFEIPASRGRIFASDNFPLVTNKEAFLVFASLPDLKQSPNQIATQLAPLLASPSAQLETEEMIKERLTKDDLVWVPLKHKVSRETKETIEKLNLAGIGFEEEEKRNYPEGSSAAHLLGFVGSDISGRDKGYFGLEGFYDWELRGRPGMMHQEKDALGRPILIGGFGKEKSEDGRDLVLFLDRTVQFIIEEKLKWGIKKYGAKAGSVVVMDPRTGGILAMASYPAYDPAEFVKFDKEIYKNSVIAGLFEPGSILKPLIMSAAFNEEVVTPKTQCDRCSGPRIIGEHTISTFNNQYHPDLTMIEVLEHSDNVGMVFVTEKLGAEKMDEYLQKFGLGEKTGIDLEEEVTNTLRPKGEWRKIDLATASFGQGVALTGIQITRAFSALANSGELLQPRVVKKISTKDEEIEIEPKVVRQVIKPQVARMITEMLVSVTEKSPLRFPRNRIPELAGYRIAAKSGTAQIPVAGHYDPEKTMASVIGFAPADNPRFTVLVSLTEPTARPWGSDTAGPIFFEILKELFVYYGIQPGG